MSQTPVIPVLKACNKLNQNNDPPSISEKLHDWALKKGKFRSNHDCPLRFSSTVGCTVSSLLEFPKEASKLLGWQWYVDHMPVRRLLLPRWWLQHGASNFHSACCRLGSRGVRDLQHDDGIWVSRHAREAVLLEILGSGTFEFWISRCRDCWSCRKELSATQMGCHRQVWCQRCLLHNG